MPLTLLNEGAGIYEELVDGDLKDFKDESSLILYFEFVKGNEEREELG